MRLFLSAADHPGQITGQGQRKTRSAQRNESVAETERTIRTIKSSPQRTISVLVCAVILAIGLSVGCIALGFDGDYDGHWQGRAVFCGTDPHCSTRHDSSTAVEMELSQAFDVLTGFMRLEGVIDSAEVTGLNAGWNGFELVGQSSCAELSGDFMYPQSIKGSVTIEWVRCDREGTEVWSMELFHDRFQ